MWGLKNIGETLLDDIISQEAEEPFQFTRPPRDTKMKIDIGNSIVRLEKEEYVKFRLRTTDYEASFYHIAEEMIDIPELIRIAYDHPEEDMYNQIFWILKFHLAFPFRQFERKFNINTLSYIDEFNQFTDENKLNMILSLGEKCKNRDNIELFLKATFQDEPTTETWSSFFRNWEGFSDWFLTNVFIEFRQLYQKTPDSMKGRVFRKYMEKKLSEGHDFFKRAQLMGEWIYCDFVDKYHKLIYRKIHNKLTIWERRIFLLMYTEQEFLGFRILSEEPRISEFVRLSPLVFQLCVLNFVFKRKVLFKVPLAPLLEELYKSYLHFFPIWHLIWRGNKIDEYYEKDVWPKRYVSTSKEVGFSGDENDKRIEDFLFASNVNPLSINTLKPTSERKYQGFSFDKFCSIVSSHISTKEYDILMDYLNGKTQQEIAHKNNCSRKTICTKIGKITKTIQGRFSPEDFMSIPPHIIVELNKVYKKMGFKTHSLKYTAGESGIKTL